MKLDIKNTLVLFILFAVRPALADPGVAFSGFLSVVGGNTFNEQVQPSNPSGKCRCYVADYSNYGTYNDQFSFAAETRFGVQAVATLTDKLSATAQLTSRGTDEAPQLQWAYMNYALSPAWDLQVGRKRIPLYYYSSFQDVGMAYPWISPPPELYGWEATNYNGISLRNRSTWSDVYVNASVFAGSEAVSDSRFMQAFGQSHTGVRWNNIVGADVELVKEKLTLRAGYLQANTAFADRDDASNDYSEKMRAYSLAANLDLNSWFVLSEWTTNVRENQTGSIAGVTITIPALSVGVGARIGRWTPYLNYAQYREISSDLSLYSPTSFDRTSLTLRYELSPSSAIKTQLDHYQRPDDDYLRALDVVRVAYERVF